MNLANHGVWFMENMCLRCQHDRPYDNLLRNLMAKNISRISNLLRQVLFYQINILLKFSNASLFFFFVWLSEFTFLFYWQISLKKLEWFEWCIFFLSRCRLTRKNLTRSNNFVQQLIVVLTKNNVFEYLRHVWYNQQSNLISIKMSFSISIQVSNKINAEEKGEVVSNLLFHDIPY